MLGRHLKTLILMKDTGRHVKTLHVMKDAAADDVTCLVARTVLRAAGCIAGVLSLACCFYLIKT
jgi:hypothetical protein